MLDTFDRILRERFGFAGFRPGQREALDALMTTGALLCIQPTGYGKSLLYQLPAAALDGVTVVISPLLALMRDQIAQLNDRFGVPAASLNSDQSLEENDAVREATRAGRVKILFVSPEQLERLDRLALITALPLELVVIDEAHCVSTWGHDFRPAYRQIATLLRAVHAERPHARVLALTATADARTEADIRAQLEAIGDRAIAVQRRSMDRPNLSLAVHPVRSFEDKLAWLARALPGLPAPGLIYCATRDNTAAVAEYLDAQLGPRGLRVSAYHAGLPPDRKRALQERFLAGDFTAIAATNALGMGIDKSDLRYVIHVDIPGSITAYYQEVGRAGRDGQPATGILLFDRADLRIQEYFIQSAQPTIADFDTLLGLIRARTAAADPPRLNDLRAASGMHPTRVTVIVAELIEQGFVEKQLIGRSQRYVALDRPGRPDLSRYARQDEVRRRELAAMTAYAERRDQCAMETLRRALGDTEAEPCGRCDACGAAVLPDAAPDAEADADAARAEAWFMSRPVVVDGYRKSLASGLAVLDSQRRSSDFLTFMRARTQPRAALDPQLVERLCAAARELAAEAGDDVPVGLVIAPPSRTWAQRDEVTRRVAAAVGARAVLDGLVWRDAPEARQGELLNNDQRKANVDGRMAWTGGQLPAGASVILLDDYVGSGATLREAARALSKAPGASAAPIPLAVARVRWRLGRPGIV